MVRAVKQDCAPERVVLSTPQAGRSCESVPARTVRNRTGLAVLSTMDFVRGTWPQSLGCNRSLFAAQFTAAASSFWMWSCSGRPCTDPNFRSRPIPSLALRQSGQARVAVMGRRTHRRQAENARQARSSDPAQPTIRGSYREESAVAIFTAEIPWPRRRG